MKYYIIAGEASGDLHGSNLMKALYQEDTEAEIRFWGGDLMRNVGGELVVHYKERAFMGFAEVITNLNKIFKLMSLCKSDILKFSPDVIIFIDNSGFNLPIAKWAKSKGFTTHYYISPQVWASRAGRVEKIKRDIDEMFVILPFEQEFYKKFKYEVNYVGHPLLDGIENKSKINEKEFREFYGLGDKKLIALLPGSRKQEITKMLTVMLSVTKSFTEYTFVVAGAPSQSKEFYNQFIKNENVKFISNKTYDILEISHAALVTSGTATLETALFKIPEVVCYKGSWLSYQIAKRIITLKYISLVNLIMDREVVKELIQDDLNTKQLTKELNRILDPVEREKMLEEYEILRSKLGNGGASQKVASKIVSYLKKNKK